MAKSDGLLRKGSVTGKADHRLRRPLLAVLYAITLAAVAWWLASGWDYYRLAATARPRHPDYARLTSGGSLGHLFGLAGSALILILLLYVVRKRWKRLARAGSLRTWLDIHIWMGVTGPLLIVLHSAFKVGGLVAFSYWSMVLVAVSGALGRYLYGQIPRDEEGVELDAGSLQTRQAALEADLDAAGLPLALRREVDHPAGGLSSWLALDLAWPLRRRRWRRELAAAGLAAPTHVLGTLRRLELLRRRRVALDLARRLLHHWHVFHRPFAAIMILFMIIHVVVALLFTTQHGAPPPVAP